MTPNSEASEDYAPPTIEVIALDCEISAYAPDGDGDEFLIDM